VPKLFLYFTKNTLCFFRTVRLNVPPMKKTPLPKLAIIALFNICLSLSAMAGDRVNVTAYGAVPDDGQDDTQAINNATNAGQSIYFPPGTYNYSGRLSVAGGKSYRFYGDGPGVSVIHFSTTDGGIVGFMGQNTLNVEGLTIQTGTANAGTAIWANFSGGKATIHNVQIRGSSTDGTSGGWWTNGIYLAVATHSIIDKVEIAGNKDATQVGLWLDAPGDPNLVAATGFNISNLQIKWCNSAFKTSGHTEGIYLTGFEFISCGRAGWFAADLNNANGGAIHLVNGTVDTIGAGVFVQNQTFVKISNVRFLHTGPEASHATILYLHNGFGATVSQCSFYGLDPSSTLLENGIYVENMASVQLNGNNFTHMRPVGGSCIVATGSGTTALRITDNLFSNVNSQYSIDGSVPSPYFLGNNP